MRYILIFFADEDVLTNECTKEVQVQLERLSTQQNIEDVSVSVSGEKLPKKHKCPKCQLVFVRRPRFIDHVKEEHPELIICAYCNSLFIKTSNFMTHALRCNKPQWTVQCTKCDFGCKSDKMLAVHDMMKHQPVSCHICNKHAGNKLNLKVHLKKFHSNE